MRIAIWIDSPWADSTSQREKTRTRRSFTPEFKAEIVGRAIAVMLEVMSSHRSSGPRGGSQMKTLNHATLATERLVIKI